MLNKAVLFLAVFFSFASLAEDPVRSDGDKYKVIFENDCVRVLEYKDVPGDKTSQHKHPAFVLYALSDFSRTITLEDGAVLQRQFKKGEAIYSGAQVHVGANTGTTPTHVVLVEMKSQVDPCASP